MSKKSQPRRVLLVDDDAIFLKALTALLEREPTIDVVGTATNGVEALRRVAELRPEVVTMDIDMPVMDGVEATRRISTRYPDVCIVTISASTSPERVEEARAAGASGHVAKARAVEELPAAIHAACPSGETARAA